MTDCIANCVFWRVLVTLYMQLIQLILAQAIITKHAEHAIDSCTLLPLLCIEIQLACTLQNCTPGSTPLKVAKSDKSDKSPLIGACSI
jgi:hypothetical protein